MAEIKGGYWGKIAWVDMTNGKVTIQNFDDEFARKYLGGVGLATKLVSDRVTKHTNPLGPGNVLVFATGPFQTTSIPSSGRSAIAAKSPLTGYWGESSGGGHLGPEMKRCGFDAIAITGKARKPSYLFVSDDGIELRDADKYWGMDNVEVVNALRQDLGIKGMSITSIGQAGENLVRYASVGNEKHGYHGRCGLGAVMGSKNLKAVVAKGSKKPPVADPEGLKEYFKGLRKEMMASEFAGVNREHGQAVAVAPREENGLLPMKNWAQGSWDKAPDISAPAFTEQLDAKPWPCPNCFMGCHRRITTPKHKNAETGGPEYETLGMIGSNLLIDNLDDLVVANEILNRYGIDTIEIGGVLGWAFECYEKGIITSQDTDGVELTWGNGKALITMCEQVGKREGFGNLLAEGIRACVDAYPGTEEYAIESMGQVFGAHDPRAFYGQVITSIASTRGACHLHGFAEANELGVVMPELGITEASAPDDNTNKGYLGAVFQDLAQVWNSLTMCLLYFFAGMDLPAEAKILNYITGWDVDSKELIKVGERIVCMQHVFNLDNGLVPKDENVMPIRMTKPHAEGGAAGQVPDWQSILAEYWATKGWDSSGVPTSAKLEELGLQG